MGANFRRVLRPPRALSLEATARGRARAAAASTGGERKSHLCRENSRTRTRRRTSSPSVHSSILTQVMPVAVLDFKPDVKRPTGCRVLGSLSLLGAPARTRRGAARCQQHEMARWWHLQLDSLLQSSSHATGGCHVHRHSRNKRQFAP